MAILVSAVSNELISPEEKYHYALGIFHGCWSAIDVTIDYAIGHFLKLPHDESHLITWGMMFGPKAALLAALIKRSDHKNRAALMTALNDIRGAAKRDVVAHGYQLYGPDHVAFLEKPRGSDFTARMHRFSVQEFIDHVDALVVNGNAFAAALDAPLEEIQAFVDDASKRAANKA